MAVMGSNGSAVLIGDDDKLDFDAVPEYVREPRPAYRDSYVSKSCYEEDFDQISHAKSAEIETLWPGVSADFLQAGSKRQPSFYIGVGFVGGILSTIALAGIVSFGMHAVNKATAHKPAQIVVASAQNGAPARANLSTERGAAVTQGAVVTTRQPVTGDPAVIMPLYSTYTVRTGDTLAGIALQAYKRATPRLLDDICKANGMRNANVLSLGQTLQLPEYRPQNTQVASGTNVSVQ